MKKILILLIFISGVFCPSYSIDENGFMDIDEYSRLFEEGEFEEEEEVEFQPVQKEKLNYDKNDVIKPDSTPYELKVQKTAPVNIYKVEYKEQNAKNELLKTKRLNIYSDGKGELSDYMTKQLKTSVNANYKVNKFFDLNAGHETLYVNPNANLGSRKLYVNPKLKLSKEIYLDYTGKFNETNENIEQEVGLNFKPKFLKDSASFGLKAGSTMNKEGETQSQKVKFTSDFYLF